MQGVAPATRTAAPGLFASRRAGVYPFVEGVDASRDSSCRRCLPLQPPTFSSDRPLGRRTRMLSRIPRTHLCMALDRQGVPLENWRGVQYRCSATGHLKLGAEIQAEMGCEEPLYRAG